MNKILSAIILIIYACIIYSCGYEQTKPITANADASVDIVKQGEVTFNKYCTICHGINKDMDKGMAPILDSVKTHWADSTQLAKYIKNAQENKDLNEHTKAMFEKWKTVPQMPRFAALSDADVQGLIVYLKYVGN